MIFAWSRRYALVVTAVIATALLIVLGVSLRTANAVTTDIEGADFTFNKTVMLKSIYDRNGESCSGSVDSLAVNYGELVVYCYRYKNTGTTTFITLTMVDDKLGSPGPLAYTIAPGGSGGLVAYGVLITQTITNTGVSTLIDAYGTSVVKSDSATVSVISRLWLPSVLRNQ